MAVSGIVTAFGWLGFVYNLILCGILSVGLAKAGAQSDHIEWSQRHWKPLRVGLLATIFFILVCCNLFILVIFLQLFSLPNAAMYFIGNFGFITCIAIYTLRAWVCHYDYHAGLALFLSVTNLEIDEDDAKEFKWFIANKQAYGSPNYLFSFTAVFVIAANVFLFGWHEVSDTTYEYALCIFYFILFVVGIAITQKLSLLDDNFFIRRELLREFRCFAGFLLVAGILIIFGEAMDWDTALFLLAESAATVFGIMGCISTFWVLRESEKVGMNKYGSLTSASAKLTDNKDSGNFDMDVADLPPISRLFNNPEATAEFIRHLVRELSVENIFFLADVMNFKLKFVEQGFLESFSNFTCQVPTTLAKVNYNLESFKRYGKDIVDMYVDGTSIFVLTSMDESVRDECIDFWDSIEDMADDKVDFNELCHSFDKIAVIIYEVVKGAYKRFSQTPEFGNIDLAEQRYNRAMSKELQSTLKQRNDKPTNWKETSGKQDGNLQLETNE